VSPFEQTAAAFVEMAHRIVWASVATVDRAGRPRGRILHPFWEWDGANLVGWVATSPTPLKRAHLALHPHVSVTYWQPDQDTCTAECGAELRVDDHTRQRIWATFAEAPAPVGYDPAIIPPWSGGPLSDAFAVLRLVPWRLRVRPGSVMRGESGELLVWSDSAPEGP
jgi:Pyridoxamine 5'-phosphate oxidase